MKMETTLTIRYLTFQIKEITIRKVNEYTLLVGLEYFTYLNKKGNINAKD